MLIWVSNGEQYKWEEKQLSKLPGVKRAVTLVSENEFGGEPDAFFVSGKRAKIKKKSKKQSSSLKPIEKKVFKLADRLDAATAVYKERHIKSNAKKKNGWIKDLPKNYMKAMSKLNR